MSGAVKLTKNLDIDKYKYSGYDIGFYRRREFSFASGFRQNVIIFGIDITSSVHANNKTKNILALGFTQGLDNTTIYAEKLYSINFTKINTKFCLSLHYNGSNIYLFDNMKRSGLSGYVYDFSVDYKAISVDDILDIHKYLMKKNNIK